MDNLNVWVVRCYIRDTRDDTDEELTGFCTVYAKQADHLEGILQQYFEKQTQHLLRVEEAFSIMGWLQQHGHNNAVMTMAQAVDANHQVQVGDLLPVERVEPEYLEVKEYDIPPLADQSHIPHQYQTLIAPELKTHLFAQPSEGKRLRTYFIVDPTLRKKVTEVFDLSPDQIDVPIQCLFKGKAAETLKEAAPYLIDMTLHENAWARHENVPTFHKAFFQHHWDKGTGIFLRTTDSFDDVLQHFRRFTKVRMEEDNRWVFFRFWDPRTIGVFLTALDKEDAYKFLASHQIIRPEAAKITHYQMAETMTEAQSRTGPPFIMKNAYLNAFNENQTHQFLEKLKHFIREKSAEFSQLSEEAQYDLLKSHLQESKHFNITIEQAMANFVLASIQYGKRLSDEARFLTILESKHHELDKTKALLNEIKERQTNESRLS
ncbi:DUF4123 domain-containing protein [Marinomonas sp. THO17]|uniref:DUF4123 domain-containing protein n=1 Tax=Marinomonas sp. THO17 TaxID=3149048 RepID=UPI00336BBB3E